MTAALDPHPAWTSPEGAEWWRVAWADKYGSVVGMTAVDLDRLAASWLKSSWVKEPLSDSFDMRLSCWCHEWHIRFADDTERARAFAYVYERHAQAHSANPRLVPQPGRRATVDSLKGFTAPLW